MQNYKNKDIIEGQVQAIGFERKPKAGGSEPRKINWLGKEEGLCAGVGAGVDILSVYFYTDLLGGLYGNFWFH